MIKGLVARGSGARRSQTILTDLPLLTLTLTLTYPTRSSGQWVSCSHAKSFHPRSRQRAAGSGQQVTGQTSVTEERNLN